MLTNIRIADDVVDEINSSNCKYAKLHRTCSLWWTWRKYCGSYPLSTLSLIIAV